jgi:hypothetical protein
MMRLLSVVLLLVAAVLLVEAAMAVGSGDTGMAEKAVIVVVAVAIVAALPRLRRMGSPHPH